MGVYRLTISLILYTNLSVHGTLIYTAVENLHKALTNISKDIKPRVDQTDRVNIDVLLSVNAIQDYDEISGTLTFTASFLFQWNDEFKTWDNNKYDGIIATKLPVLKTWMPVLHLRNGVDSNSIFTYRNNMEIETSTVTYATDGNASFVIMGMYQVSCETDVTYYPFDEHKCVISLLTLDFLSEITLTSIFGIDFGVSSPHAEWAIKNNSTKAIKRSITIQVAAFTTTQDQIDFTIIIKREHRFPILNIVLPVTSLSIVQTLVFLLPAESVDGGSSVQRENF
ncbi:acetylcholine receptor subunit gamma-like [Mytilus trossulus]|uniref:acetylcholine receptor subunit gamma-like n=1 Tax=Mytilus trossulus TaxID=6551 RepID=UPI0030071B1C